MNNNLTNKINGYEIVKEIKAVLPKPSDIVFEKIWNETIGEIKSRNN